MIKAVFYRRNKSVVGFEISGHSGYAGIGEDIICASVSSAAYMAANTVTDVIFDEADIAQSDGYMKLTLKEGSEKSEAVLEGLFLHVKNLSKDYRKYVSCKQKLFKE